MVKPDTFKEIKVYKVIKFIKLEEQEKLYTCVIKWGNLF
jgi:hypothetical protein